MLENEIHLTGAFRQWWIREREHATPFKVLHQLLGISWEFLRDSLPSRRRQRYGDADYDWQFRVDTTSATVSWRTRLLGLLNSPYQPIPSEEFIEIMTALTGAISIDLRQFTFIDVGSGKGRALLLAAAYPFRRIIGIEMLPELHRIAHQNVSRLSDPTRVELLCGDATQFVFPPEPTVVLLFNPLPSVALSKLLKNLEMSLVEDPRPLYVAYANPVLEHIIASSRLLTKFGGTNQYSVFANK